MMLVPQAQQLVLLSRPLLLVCDEGLLTICTHKPFKYQGAFEQGAPQPVLNLFYGITMTAAISIILLKHVIQVQVIKLMYGS